MEPSTFLTLVLACAPQMHADTASAPVRTESAFHPWAIGVVGGALTRQPRSRAEALATARALQAAGWNYSVGLGQINRGNFERLGLTTDTAFAPCTNLNAMQTVLTQCMARIPQSRGIPHPQERLPMQGTPPELQTRLRKALSCYYSGNFVTGFTHGYVRRVARAMPAAPP